MTITQISPGDTSLSLDNNMADPKDPQINSPLNPTAPTFTMPPPQSPTTSNGAPPPTPTNGQSKPPKPTKKPEAQTPTPTSNPDTASTGTKLTGAQLKAQKKAEKAAKRAAGAPPQPQPSATKPDLQRRLSANKKEEPGSAHHKRAGSVVIPNKTLPLRPAADVAMMATAKPPPEKKVAMFSHLYPSSSRKPTLSTAGKEVHPAVLTLGLQLRDFVICGSSARTIAMLLVFKRVITDYTTPDGVALSRHLTIHLGHQIGWLSSCRGLCVSQGNAIRWLKKLVSGLDVGMGEAEAKELILGMVDDFVREKFTLADELICGSVGRRVAEGDVLLLYGKSAVVEKAVVAAWRKGRRFSVVVVDSRPLFEGKNLARGLAGLGVPVKYCLLSGLPELVGDCSKCFLGASAMLGNGRLSARAGTAMVAMMAKDAGIPVIVLCESVKFTGKVALDSVVMNEIGDADSLVGIETDGMLTTTVQPTPEAKKGGKKNRDDDEPDETKQQRGLEGWREIQNLQLLNLMYDVTPAEYLDMVITEQGDLPPSAVPVVNGILGGED
jgi:translation initiation factor eIF-2B subunit delta